MASRPDNLAVFPGGLAVRPARAPQPQHQAPLQPRHQHQAPPPAPLPAPLPAQPPPPLQASQQAPQPQHQAPPPPPRTASPPPRPVPEPDIQQLTKISPPIRIDPRKAKLLAVAARNLAQIGRMDGIRVLYQAVELGLRFDNQLRTFDRYDKRGLNSIQYGWATKQEEDDRHRVVVCWQPVGWGWFEIATQITVWSFTGRNWVGLQCQWPGTIQVLTGDYPEGMPLVGHFRNNGFQAAAVNPNGRDQLSWAPITPAAKVLAANGVRAFVVARAATFARRIEGNETFLDKLIHKGFAISAAAAVAYKAIGWLYGY